MTLTTDKFDIAFVDIIDTRWNTCFVTFFIYLSIIIIATFKNQFLTVFTRQTFGVPEKIKHLKMSRFRFGRQHDGYRLLSNDDSGFSDAQFEAPPPKIPWKAISLAAFLFIVGTSLLIVGSLIVTGHIDTKYSDRLWPMIVLGCIMFLPGAYHIRIAYYAYKEYPGYSFSDIPEFE